MKNAQLLLLLCLTASAPAHPGGGIIALGPNSVVAGDSVNNAVWHFESGKTPVKIVEKFHAHWVTRGLDGKMYIEAFQEFGGAWPSAAFRLDSLTSKPEVVVERDKLGALVFLVNAKGELVYPLGPGLSQRDAKGKVTNYMGSGRPAAGEPALQDVSSMAWGPDGVVYVADGARIRRVDKDGRLRVIAQVRGNLLSPGFWAKTEAARVWGITVDARNRVYAAVPDTGEVVRIDADGTQRVVNKTPDGWRASAVSTFGSSIFVLETHPLDLNAGMRVRVIRESGVEEILGVAKG